MCEHRRELALRIDDEAAGETPAWRTQRREEDREHDGQCFARAGISEGERVAGEHIARNGARIGVEQAPLGDDQTRGGRRSGGRSRRVADVVNEAKEAGNGRGDQPPRCGRGICRSPQERVAILRANRAAHRSLEQPGEPARGARAALRSRGQRGRQPVEDGQIGGVHAGRDRHHAAGEGPIDEPSEESIVEVRQIGEQHRRRSRSDGGVGAHAEAVVDERRTRLGDPLVTEREQQRRGARRTVDDARAHPDAGGAPALVRSEVVLEGGRDAAERRDLNLDQIVEVDPGEKIDRLDQVDGGGEVELT